MPTGPTRPRPTKESVIKQGWGNKSWFQRCHGLKTDPEDMEEGELILEEMLKGAIEEWEEEQRVESTMVRE